MAKRHNDDETQKETPTDASDEKAPSTSRRTFIKTVGAAAAIGGSTTLLGNARAQGSVEEFLDASGDVTIPAGEYSWSGSGVDIASGDSLVGEGNPGDVVWNLESGTMSGSVEGTLENVVVRGDNPQSKSGLDLHPGSVVDGFIWPEGGGQGEDRAFYHPDGGSERTTVRNSAIAWMANNGAYTDKAPATYENVAAVNNNIANIRVGHRERRDVEPDGPHDVHPELPGRRDPADTKRLRGRFVRPRHPDALPGQLRHRELLRRLPRRHRHGRPGRDPRRSAGRQRRDPELPLPQRHRRLGRPRQDRR